MTINSDAMTNIERRIDENRERHRQDVGYVQANHPEMAKWLAEMTREFGRRDYRVTLRVDK